MITGKPIRMDFPLKRTTWFPVNTCIDAMRGFGRVHTTRNFEPYKAYNIREGDLAVAMSNDKMVVFKVGKQYRIRQEEIEGEARYCGRYAWMWGQMEKHDPDVLRKLFKGKQEVWGLKMSPIGDWVDGEIVDFPFYSPSRQELLKWYQLADGDRPRIKELGQKLNAIYGEVAPLNFRDKSVVLNWDEVDRMIATVNREYEQLSLLVSDSEEALPDIEEGDTGW